VFPGQEVDLAVLDRADPLLLKQVLEGCRLLAGSPRRLAELKMYAFRRYQDHRRFLDLERAPARTLGRTVQIAVIRDAVAARPGGPAAPTGRLSGRPHLAGGGRPEPAGVLRGARRPLGRLTGAAW
jgi:hypothetical protein